MTTPNPTPEQNLPSAPDSEETRSNSEDQTSPSNTGFFNRVQRQLNPEKLHPSVEQEIVVMGEEQTNDGTEL